MNRPIVDKIHKFPLSSARRSFVLVEILHRARAFGLTDIEGRIEELLDCEIQTMNERFVAGRYQMTNLPSLEENYRAAKQERQCDFLALILYIERTYSPSRREVLLAPILQQIERLHYFAGQSELSNLE